MFRICAAFLVFVISSYAAATEDGEKSSSPASLVEGTTIQPGEHHSSLTSWIDGTSTPFGEKTSSLRSRIEETSTLFGENGPSLKSLIEGISTPPGENGPSLSSWVQGSSTPFGGKSSSVSWVEKTSTLPDGKTSSQTTWVERTSLQPGEKTSSQASWVDGTSTQTGEKRSSITSRVEGTTMQPGEKGSSLKSWVEETITQSAGEKGPSSSLSSRVEGTTTQAAGEKSTSQKTLVEGTSTLPGEKTTSLKSRIEETTTQPGQGVSSLTGWVEGTSTKSGESTKIFFGPVPDSKSEIVLRDLKDVSVHCQADYPVQLDFESHTGFKLLATGSGSSSRFFSNNTHQINVQQHTNYAHLVSLKEAYTGLYICKGRGSKTKNNSISIYIYVPTEKIFISTKTGTISADHNPLVIPCPIADPNATVALVKLHKDESVKSVSNATYNPKVGFTLEKTSGGNSNDTNMDGSYYCIAKTKQNHHAVGFIVVKGPVECTKRCFENAKCQLVNEQQVCECKPGYKETFVSEKCLKQCKTDKDCPSNMACIPQESGSFLLEILSSVEQRRISSFLDGKSSSSSSSGEEEGDEDEQFEKSGECKNPCIYRTTSCSLGASRNPDEVCKVEKHKAVCKV